MFNGNAKAMIKFYNLVSKERLCLLLASFSTLLMKPSRKFFRPPKRPPDALSVNLPNPMS